MRDRSQAVHVNSNESASTVLKFGVPQGSVLGPKIFIDYAEDVSEIFTQHDHSQHLFAGDMQCLSCGKPAEVPYMVTRIENCVADCQTSHYSPESWCSDGRRVIDARPRLATGADMLFFTYAVYAQCVVSSAKTSRNDWFVLSYSHDSTTVT